MTDEYDEMFEDIKKQEILKPTQFPIKEEMDIGFGEPKGLEDIPQYKENNYIGDEDLSDTFRMRNASMDDLMPKNYEILGDDDFNKAYRDAYKNTNHYVSPTEVGMTSGGYIPAVKKVIIRKRI